MVSHVAFSYAILWMDLVQIKNMIQNIKKAIVSCYDTGTYRAGPSWPISGSGSKEADLHVF